MFRSFVIRYLKWICHFSWRALSLIEEPTNTNKTINCDFRLKKTCWKNWKITEIYEWSLKETGGMWLTNQQIKRMRSLSLWMDCFFLAASSWLQGLGDLRCETPVSPRGAGSIKHLCTQQTADKEQSQVQPTLTLTPSQSYFMPTGPLCRGGGVWCCYYLSSHLEEKLMMLYWMS